MVYSTISPTAVYDRICTNAVDDLRERAGGSVVPAGLGGGLVGERLVPDLVGPIAAFAGDAEAARQQAVAGCAAHRVGFAGEQRLVDFEKAAPQAPGRRRRSRLAGAEQDVLAQDDVAGGDLLDRGRRERTRALVSTRMASLSRWRLARISWARPRAVLTIAMPLTAIAALVLAEDEQGDGRGRHHGVEPGEQVAGDDGCVVAPLGAGRAVDLAAPDALGHLGGGQALRLVHPGTPTRWWPLGSRPKAPLPCTRGRGLG